MTTAYGANTTIARSPTPSTLMAGGKWRGKVRVMVDSYEAVSLAAGSTIYIAQLPAYSTVLGISNVTCDALGSGHTIAAGITGATSKFFAANEFNTAKERVWFDVVDGMHYQPTSATWVILTTASAVVNGTIKSEVYYAQE